MSGYNTSGKEPKNGGYGGNKDKKASGGGAGTQALASGSGFRNYAKPGEDAMSQAQAARPSGMTAPGKQTEGSGGTTKPSYVTPMDQPAPPGATPYDEGATPYGVASTVFGGISNAMRRAFTQGFTGKDPDADEMGTQTGWSADRTKGGTFNSNDPRGADAGLLDDEREIAGRPFRADSTDEADDPVSETPGASASGDIYSDVMLKDRRKPTTTLKQMLESML